jgi:uncharacterized protein (DUF433 family)
MAVDLYGGRDPREIPAYTVARTAKIAGVATSTLRSWLRGGPYKVKGGIERYEPLLEFPEPSTPYLSFINVVEAHMLAAIRRVHGVPMNRIRPALDFVKTNLNIAHPLASKTFETDGYSLFIREFGEIINASRGGQIVFREIVEAHLQRIEYDDQDLAKTFYPFRQPLAEGSELKREPKVIMVDPRIQFGKPILKSIGVPTAVIYSRWYAGENFVDIAKDLNADPSEIEDATRFESKLAA